MRASLTGKYRPEGPDLNPANGATLDLAMTELMGDGSMWGAATKTLRLGPGCLEAHVPVKTG